MLQKFCNNYNSNGNNNNNKIATFAKNKKCNQTDIFQSQLKEVFKLVRAPHILKLKNVGK